MGTPEFAVPAMEAIYEHFNLVAVVTVPDKPAGRGKKLQESAVKQGAIKLGLPILQPTKLKDPDFINQLSAFSADLFVVVAFRMLPAAVFEMPQLGCLNLHASLLPDYRGAAPINWVIINGESKSGLTTFLIEQEIDTGLILKQTEMVIGKNETAGHVHDRMMKEGATLLVQTIQGIADGSVIGRPQSLDPGKTYHQAPKIYRETGQIAWKDAAYNIHNLIRGLNPYPGAYTTVSRIGQVETMKIWASSVFDRSKPYRTI